MAYTPPHTRAQRRARQAARQTALTNLQNALIGVALPLLVVVGIGYAIAPMVQGIASTLTIALP